MANLLRDYSREDVETCKKILSLSADELMECIDQAKAEHMPEAVLALFEEARKIVLRKEVACS